MAISKWIFLGLLLAGSTLFFREAAATSLSGTLSRTGLAGANLGTGIQETLTGTGIGLSKLLNPFFSFADLIGKFQGVLSGGGFDSSNNAGGGLTPQSIDRTPKLVTTARLPSGGGTSTITWGSGTTASVPTLSAAAKAFYSNVGVSVSDS
tara:strand:- start:42 stop:494 length:453 start_codon:yes stop_codon:yes gene_type:complete